MLGNKLDYSNWLKEKLNGSAKEFKKGTSKIKLLQTFEQKLASIILRMNCMVLLTVGVC